MNLLQKQKKISQKTVANMYILMGAFLTTGTNDDLTGSNYAII